MYPHGTLTAYRKDRCRCEECKDVALKYQKRLRYDHHKGNRRLVCIQPVIEHIAWLQEHGVSVSEIARQVGWGSPNSVRTMQRRKSIRVATYERVMAVLPGKPVLDDCSLVPSLGTMRRLRALTCIGWQLNRIAELSSTNAGTLSEIRSGKVKVVRQSTHRRVNDAYEALHMQHGGSARSVMLAERRKWAPPMAWDDIDDPSERTTGRVAFKKKTNKKEVAR